MNKPLDTSSSRPRTTKGQPADSPAGASPIPGSLLVIDDGFAGRPGRSPELARNNPGRIK